MTDPEVRVDPADQGDGLLVSVESEGVSVAAQLADGADRDEIEQAAETLAAELQHSARIRRESP